MSMKLTKQDKELIKEAKIIAKKLNSKISCVGSALRTSKGKIYSGANIFNEDSAPVSICAEYSAIAQAHANKMKKINTIVAVGYWNKKYHIMLPCGKCREFIKMFGNPWIIKSANNKIKLKQLLPR